MNHPLDYGSRGRLGVLLPSGNTAVEVQFSAFALPGMSVHYTRLRLAGSTVPELLAMTEGVEQAARLLKDAQVALIAFHCTAVSMWAPELEEGILKRIKAATGLPAVMTSHALVAALGKFGAKRIVMLSPYVEHIATREEQYMRQSGFDVLTSRKLHLASPGEMLDVLPQTWLSELEALRNDSADAYLVSCTATRAMEIVSEAERRLGRPVLTSNSAMLWHASRLLGLVDHKLEWGRLGAAD